MNGWIDGRSLLKENGNTYPSLLFALLRFLRETDVDAQTGHVHAQLPLQAGLLLACLLVYLLAYFLAYIFCFRCTYFLASFLR